MKKWIIKNIEFIVVVILTAIIFYFLFYSRPTFLNVYHTLQINNSILAFTGTLFGLLLTAYSILIALLPAINKDILRTDSFVKVNHSFFVSIMLTIFVVIDSFLIFIYDNTFLIYLQMMVLTLVILMSILLVIYLYLLIKVARKEIINH